MEGWTVTITTTNDTYTESGVKFYKLQEAIFRLHATAYEDEGGDYDRILKIEAS